MEEDSTTDTASIHYLNSLRVTQGNFVPILKSPKTDARGTPTNKAGTDRGGRGRPALWMRIVRSGGASASAEELVGLRQEAGEVELVGASPRAASRSAPCQLRAASRSLGVEPARLGAVAVVLVIGEEPGQVAQLGRRCRRRRLHRPSQPVHIVGPAAMQASRSRSSSAVVIGLKVRAASAFSRIWSVFRIETQHDENRSSVQIACSRRLVRA